MNEQGLSFQTSQTLTFLEIVKFCDAPTLVIKTYLVTQLPIFIFLKLSSGEGTLYTPCTKYRKLHRFNLKLYSKP